MANVLLTPSVIAKETLAVIENNLTFVKQVNRQYESQFAKNGNKIGDTVNIRKPVKWTVRDGSGFAGQDVVENSIPLKIDNYIGVDFSFSDFDLTLTIDEFSKRYLKTAGAKLANELDRRCLVKATQGTYNEVGTPGTVPTDETVYVDAGVRLDNEAAPRDRERAVVISPRMQGNMIKSQKGLFQSAEQIANQYESGTMGLAYGFKWSMDQNVIRHVVGPQGGTPLTNGVPVSGATTLATDGWTNSAALRLRKGDVFTIAGVNAVNPQNLQDTGELRQFVATADVNSDGAGNATIPISPAIISTGAYQNVTALPADNVAITVLGSSGQGTYQGLAFHKDAFTLACVDLEDVSSYGAWCGRASSNQLGISVRVAKQWDVNTASLKTRMDLLFGFAVLYSEWSVRIASGAQ